MDIQDKIAVVTGAASGIGKALCFELANQKIKSLALVDQSKAVEDVVESLNAAYGDDLAISCFEGDVRDESFRVNVFDQVVKEFGVPSICVPVAGITRDALAVKVDKATGLAEIYGQDKFREVMEVNAIAPIYWALELISRIAEDRFKNKLGKWNPSEHIQGTVIFIGSISSLGNKGQISYATAKAGLEGAAATMMKESMFYGVRCGVIHPGYTDTPMVRSMGEELIDKYILPQTQLQRLIKPEEIANAVCFMISNSAVSGQLWADAGWHPYA